MYTNVGIVEGKLASEPYIINENIVLATVRVVEMKKDKKTGKREVNYVSVFAYGKLADKIKNANLEKNQEIKFEYKINSHTKEVNGEKKRFEDKVAIHVVFGSRPRKKIEEEPVDKDFLSDFERK